MKTAEAVKGILKAQKVTQVTLAYRLGVSKAVINARFRQDNISIRVLNEMLKVLDYKIVIVPRETKLKEDWYEVE